MCARDFRPYAYELSIHRFPCTIAIFAPAAVAALKSVHTFNNSRITQLLGPFRDWIDKSHARWSQRVGRAERFARTRGLWVTAGPEPPRLRPAAEPNDPIEEQVDLTPGFPNLLQPKNTRNTTPNSKT